MLTSTEYSLIQKHPEYKEVSKSSPVYNNLKQIFFNVRVKPLNRTLHPIKKTVAEEMPIVSSAAESNCETPEQNLKKKGYSLETDDFDQYLKDLINVETPELNHEIEELNPKMDDLDQELPDLNRDTFTLYELLKMYETEIAFLVENIIPESSITILSGDSEGGKTSLYQQLCIAIIQGITEFLGLKLKVKYKSALIINTEDAPISIKVRLQKQLSETKLSTEESKRLTVMTLSRDVVPKIESLLRTNPVDLVVIDAFSDVYVGDTRSDNAARMFMNQFIELIQKYGCSILFVHHIGKGKDSLGPNKDSMLGSVAIHGKARSVLQLTKHRANPMIKTLKIVKGNYIGEDIKSKQIILAFDPKTLLHKVVVDDFLKEEIETQPQHTGSAHENKRGKRDLLMQEAWKLKESGNTLEAIGKIVGRDKSTISKWLTNRQPLHDVSKVIQ